MNTKINFFREFEIGATKEDVIAHYREAMQRATVCRLNGNETDEDGLIWSSSDFWFGMARGLKHRFPEYIEEFERADETR